MKIQLEQIYGRGISQTTIKIPYVKQQNDGHDYGLFAIANMIEFVADKYHGLQDGRLGFVYTQGEMQKHLVKCFGQRYMGSFPKIKLTAPKKIDMISVDIDLLYCCSIPDAKGLGPWIAWFLQNVKVLIVAKYQIKSVIQT